MYTRHRKIGWAIVVFVMLGGIVGCSDSNKSSLTAPVSSALSLPKAINNGVTTVKFGVFKTFGQFGVQVPQGTYLLTYKTGIGTFQVVFQASETAVMPIGLQPGDDVSDASLQQGTVAATTPVVQQIGTIAVFITPGTSAVPVVVNAIFTAAPFVASVVLIQEGQVVPSDLVENVDANDEATQFGIVQGTGVFELYVPTGDYLVTYATKLGVFQLVVRANYGNFFQVALMPGDEVLTISIQQGSIPVGTPEVQNTGEGIIFYAMPGLPVVLSNIFIVKIGFTPVLVLEDGQIVVSIKVIVFTESERKKHHPKKHFPKGNAWGYWTNFGEA